MQEKEIKQEQPEKDNIDKAIDFLKKLLIVAIIIGILYHIPQIIHWLGDIVKESKRFNKIVAS